MTNQYDDKGNGAPITKFICTIHLRVALRNSSKKLVALRNSTATVKPNGEIYKYFSHSFSISGRVYPRDLCRLLKFFRYI